MSLAKRYSLLNHAKVALGENSQDGTPESGQHSTVSESDALCSPERGSLLSTLSVNLSLNDSQVSEFNKALVVSHLTIM